MPAQVTARRRYAGKSADERRAERRKRLLDAGLELFGTRGYATTTIEHLCAASRCNPRYFYEEFATREALLGAVYERHIDAVTRAVLGAVAAAPEEPRPRIAAGLRAFLDHVLADERGARINYFEMVGVSPALERRRRSVLGAYADFIGAEIAAAARRRPIPVPDHRLAAVAFVGATDGLVLDWLAREPRGDRTGMADTLLGLVDVILDG